MGRREVNTEIVLLMLLAMLAIPLLLIALLVCVVLDLFFLPGDDDEDC